ncbi:MAG: VOC family protein [Micromonosporaceae bacterium]
MSSRHSRATTLRRIAAGTFVFVGLFVISFGIGYQRVGVILAGVAVLLLSVSGRLVTSLRGTVRHWVTGTAEVLSVASPPPQASYGRCEMEVLVNAPGLPREAVTIREPRVAVDQWPYPGLVLPVEVAADDVRNVRILWREYVPEESGPEEPGHGWQPDRDATPEAPDDDLDFDLDGPPTVGVRAGAAPEAGGPVAGGHDPTVRVPRPRPSPRPAPGPTAAAAGPHASTATEDAAVLPRQVGATGPAIRSVQGVGATLLVTDVEASVRFYRDLLGFEVLDRDEDSVVLASGSTRLVLRRGGGMDRVRRRVVHLHLEVDDLPAAHAALRDAGVSFTSPPRVVTRGSRMEQWAAAFRDPDGHGIALTEWRRL